MSWKLYSSSLQIEVHIWQTKHYPEEMGQLYILTDKIYDISMHSLDFAIGLDCIKWHHILNSSLHIFLQNQYFFYTKVTKSPLLFHIIMQKDLFYTLLVLFFCLFSDCIILKILDSNPNGPDSNCKLYLAVVEYILRIKRFKSSERKGMCSVFHMSWLRYGGFLKLNITMAAWLLETIPCYSQTTTIRRKKNERLQSHLRVCRR